VHLSRDYMHKRIVTTAAVAFLVIALVTTPSCKASTLSLEATTNKEFFNLGEPVRVLGNLTKNGLPVTDGLIGLQVDDPNNTTMVMRTLKAGTFSGEELIKIVDFYPSNSIGQRRSSFQAGTWGYFNVTIYNNATISLNVALQVNVFDSVNFTLGLSTGWSGPVVAKTTLKYYPSIYIPSGASTGNATAFATAFTGNPRNGGTPYCLEKSAAFSIQGGASNPGVSIPPTNIIGAYNTTFRLPTDRKSGDYLLFANSLYGGEAASRITGFSIKLPGDANGDGFVDVSDFAILAASWFKSLGQTGYDARADFTGNGFVDVSDFSILAGNWFKGSK